jgi:hypothetical protein
LDIEFDCLFVPDLTTKVELKPFEQIDRIEFERHGGNNQDTESNGHVIFDHSKEHPRRIKDRICYDPDDQVHLTLKFKMFVKFKQFQIMGIVERDSTSHSHWFIIVHL